MSTFRNILKAGIFLCLFGKLIVGIRVCKNTAEVSEKRKIGVVFSVVSVENKLYITVCYLVIYCCFCVVIWRRLNHRFFGLVKPGFLCQKNTPKSRKGILLFNRFWRKL